MSALKNFTDIVDYTVAVLGVMGLIATLDWFLYARKHFRGPSKATLDAIEAENHMEDMAPHFGAVSSLEDEKKDGTLHLEHHL